MSFFSAFFGSCRGPYVFDMLRRHSLLRVVWHILLLLMFSSVFVGVGEYMRLRYQWRGARSQFIEIFGEELYFTKNGILPGKAQNIGRCQELPYNGLLIYAARDGRKEYSEQTLRDRNFIIFWSSSNISVSVRGDGNRWVSLRRGPENLRSVDEPQEIETFEQMRQKLNSMIAAPPSDKWNYGKDMPEYIPVYRIYDFFRAVRATSVALAYCFEMLMLMIAGIGLYVVMYRLLNSDGKYRFLTASEQWKVSIYAAFPVVAVVGVFPMLQLPFVQYSGLLFIIGWVFYQFVVLNYLRSLNVPEAAEQKGDNDEQ